MGVGRKKTKGCSLTDVTPLYRGGPFPVQRCKRKRGSFVPPSWGWAVIRFVVGGRIQCSPVLWGLARFRCLLRRHGYAVPRRGGGPSAIEIGYLIRSASPVHGGGPMRSHSVLPPRCPPSWGWARWLGVEPVRLFVSPTLGVGRGTVNTDDRILYFPPSWGWVTPIAARLRRRCIFPHLGG